MNNIVTIPLPIWWIIIIILIFIIIGWYTYHKWYEKAITDNSWLRKE